MENNTVETNAIPSLKTNTENASPVTATPLPPSTMTAPEMLGEHLQNSPIENKVYLDHEGNPYTGGKPAPKVRFRFPVWLKVSGAFVLGVMLGLFVMKRHYAADRVIVSVGSETIQAQDFYPRLEAIAGPQVLRQMITETLTRQYAQQHHLLPTPAEVQSRAAQISAQSAFASATRRPLAPTEAQQMAQAQSLAERMVTSGVDVTDAEIQAYYKEQADPRNPAASFFRPETVRLAVIVTPSAEGAQQAEIALQRGTPFADVAKTYSQDRSAAQGGELPPILRGRTPARQVYGLEDIIFGLSPGETTRPRKLMGAWWIMTCLDKTTSQTLPFAQVQAQCQREARLLKAQRVQGAQRKTDFEQYCQSVPMQVFWQRYAPTVQDQEHRLSPGKL